jgi:hypothetical protein
MNMQTIERSDGIWRIAILTGAAALIAAIYFFWPQPEPPALPPTAAVAPPEAAPAPTPAPQAEPMIEHPIKAVMPPEAPPPLALDDSDGAIAAALGACASGSTRTRWCGGSSRPSTTCRVRRSR